MGKFTEFRILDKCSSICGFEDPRCSFNDLLVFVPTIRIERLVNFIVIIRAASMNFL